jgi:hypothetical protein
MAVFDERRELNKQKRHMPANWDDNFGLKLLGYNKQGKNNALGHVLNFIPGVNTGRHALAMGAAGGDTKKVLKGTFDEAVGRDFAGAAFGINVAKTIGTGGLGGGAGKMGNLFSKVGQGKKMGAEFADEVSGIASEMGGGNKGVGSALDVASGALESSGNPDQEAVDSLVAEKLVNPYEEGTDEYNMFEEKKMNQEGGLKNKFKKMGGDFLKSAGAGNLFESGANLLATSIADYKAENEEFQKYARGTFADPSAFSYL